MKKLIVAFSVASLAVAANATLCTVEESASPTAYSTSDFTTINWSDASSFLTSVGMLQSFTATQGGVVSDISVSALRLGTGTYTMEVYESFAGDGVTPTANPDKFRLNNALWMPLLASYDFTVTTGLGSGSPGGSVTVAFSPSEQFSFVAGNAYAVNILTGTGTYWYQKYANTGTYADGAAGYDNGAPTGRDVPLAYNVIPEPATIGLIGVCGIGMLAARRIFRI